MILYKKFFNKILALLLSSSVLMMSLLSLSGCSNNEGNSEITLQNFAADETYFVVGTESAITFTVDAEGITHSVNLCRDDGTVVGVMHDDGLDGDVTAGDGTYTYMLTVTYDSAISVDYYANVSNIFSDNVTIYSFEIPTDKTVVQNDIDEIQNNISDIEENYKNDSGYVNIENVSKVISEVEDYIKNEKTEDILLYEVYDNSIYIKLKSGITYVYEPALEGVSAGGSDISLTIATYQPNPDVSSKSLSKNAKKVAKKLDNCSYSDSNNYEGEEVTLSVIKSLGNNQVVLWNGHGGYSGKLEANLATGEYFSVDEYINNSEYQNDNVQERTIIVSTNYQQNLIAVTSKFIDYYCGDLSNDLIFLGTCHSGQSKKLPNTFIEKGAKAVLGFNGTVYSSYNEKIFCSIIADMSEINIDTNNYYTLSEALDKAKSEFGNNDLEYANKNHFTDIKSEVATPVIFGGSSADNYRLSDIENQPLESVDNFTLPDSKTLTIGEIDLLEPEITPEDTTEYTIKWTSSDESIVAVNPTGEYGILTGKSKGTATITAELTSGSNVITQSTEVRVASKGRDTVLVLDVSGSMAGTAITEMKEAALDFCNELLTDEYDNRVGLVCYDDNTVVYDLTDDIDLLTDYISSIQSGGSTNMYTALEEAESMLDNYGNSDHIRNIVVMADGLPNVGQTSSSGSAGFTSGSLSIFSSDEYANAVVDIADDIMQKYNMYSLGFFHSLSGSEYDNCSTLMSKLTNMENGYHEVDQAENLQFEFGDIADDITNGSKIVINIACPVDVSVSYDGETLSSASDSYNDTVSFGTLQLLGSKQDVKVLSLDSDKVYDVELNGTDTGTMDYSVNYLNENDEITDYRNFSSVPITNTTIIDSSTDNSTTVNLNIDNDGDGAVDIVWGADSNSDAEIIEDNTPTEPETTEPQTTTSETEPSNKLETNNEGNNNAFMIAVIVLCSVIAAAVIILLLFFALGYKKDESIDELSAPSENNINKSENKDDKIESYAFIEILSGSMSGMEIPVKDGEIIAVGKNPALCQVVFTSDYAEVSRLHCTVMYDKNIGKFFITDSSSNGTYFSTKRRLEKGRRTAVRNGTILYLSDEKCAIRLMANNKQHL